MSGDTSSAPNDFQAIRDASARRIRLTRERLATASPAGRWLAFFRERASHGWVAEAALPLEHVVGRHGESIAGLGVKIAVAELLAGFTAIAHFRPARQEERTQGPSDPVNLTPPGEPSEWPDAWPERATPAAVREFEERVAVLHGTYARLLTLTRSDWANIPSVASDDEWDERSAEGSEG